MSSQEVNDFQKEVIERSHSIPVLVDFWAEWCGPCRVLGPVLERVAEMYRDRLVLVKVDTDANASLSMQYGIRGIPAVKLFVEGKVEDEFTGALPEPAVVKWLDRALPDKFQKTLDEAARLLAAGKQRNAEEIALSVLSKEPKNERAAVLAAQAVVWRDSPRAAEFVKGIEEHSGHFPVVEAVRTIEALRLIAEDPSGLPDDPVKTDYLEGAKATGRRDFPSAVDRFIEVIRTNRMYDNDGARKACIALFRLLGDEHEITLSRRRDFSSALNS